MLITYSPVPSFKERVYMNSNFGWKIYENGEGITIYAPSK